MGERRLDRSARNQSHIEQYDVIEVIAHGFYVVVHDKHRFSG